MCSNRRLDHFQVGVWFPSTLLLHRLAHNRGGRGEGPTVATSLGGRRARGGQRGTEGGSSDGSSSRVEEEAEGEEEEGEGEEEGRRRCGESWPFWVDDQMTAVRPSSLRIGWKAALPTQGRYVLQTTSDHPFPWYLVWSRRGVRTWCMHW